MVSLKAWCKTQRSATTSCTAVTSLLAFVSRTVRTHDTVWFGGAFQLGDEVTTSQPGW